MTEPRIWALLGHRRGDNNQLLALCEALDLPFETRTLRHNPLRVLGPRLLGGSTVSLTRDSRRHVQPPWPDLVLTIGRRSVPVARDIQRRSGMAARIVVLGNPRISLRHFDLVITTPQYPVKPAQNVLRLPLSISRRGGGRATESERSWLTMFNRPHLLLLLGGSTKDHRLRPGSIARAAARLAERAEADGGTLIVCPSPRTEPQVLQAVANSLDERRHRIVSENFPRYPVLLSDADQIFVTGDSMSMLSEAAITGRPVGLVPVEITSRGRLRLGRERHAFGRSGKRRDIRQAWKALLGGGYVGTLENPTSTNAVNPLGEAAAAVRRLIGESS